ncbi:hypothetical protein ATO10_04662 [Actibacterium atlanticum]|uniref:Uncharacterized protein n=1 Tax=Actibacterium atlanticum TaxID=1461693 RepID=A0A058ZNW0_9RHOB|nr:hypothetical protein [Actibacterium atlanticum]KCV82872.1 hypothetical protein ATO10_04662 [Actibacterium atlanticum]
MTTPKIIQHKKQRDIEELARIFPNAHIEEYPWFSAYFGLIDYQFYKPFSWQHEIEEMAHIGDKGPDALMFSTKDGLYLVCGDWLAEDIQENLDQLPLSDRFSRSFYALFGRALHRFRDWQIAKRRLPEHPLELLEYEQGVYWERALHPCDAVDELRKHIRAKGKARENVSLCIPDGTADRASESWKDLLDENKTALSDLASRGGGLENSRNLTVQVLLENDGIAYNVRRLFLMAVPQSIAFRAYTSKDLGGQGYWFEFESDQVKDVATLTDIEWIIRKVTEDIPSSVTSWEMKRAQT